MRQTTKPLHISIKTLSLILFIGTMSASMCVRRTVIEGNPEAAPAAAAPSPAKPQDKDKPTIIVLLHGLGHVVGGKSGLEPLKTRLESDLAGEKNVTVIAPARADSFTDSITKQVDTLYAELQKNHKDSKLIIYGHSQGAVIAASLWCRYKDHLNIIGLELDRGPLAGFDPLTNQNLSQYQHLLSNFCNLVTNQASLLNYINHLNQKGVQDLKPGSQVLNEIKSNLPNINIPVLLILGETDFLENFEKGLDLAPNWLNQIYTALLQNLQIIGLNSLFGAPNDGLISKDSQKFKKLLGSKKNVIEKSYTVGGAVFEHGLLITDPKMGNAYNDLLGHIKSCIKKP